MHRGDVNCLHRPPKTFMSEIFSRQLLLSSSSLVTAPAALHVIIIIRVQQAVRLNYTIHRRVYFITWDTLSDTPTAYNITEKMIKKMYNNPTLFL